MTDKHKQTAVNDEQTQAARPEFIIQRVYIKDVSFESPSAPDVFRTEWNPEVDLGLNTESVKIADDVYEVVLKVNVTAKLKGKVVFLIELQQAGIFTLKLFPQEQLQHMLASFCPSVLFPYAREVVSDLVSRGTFPPLYLAPVNFDALYQQHLEREKNKDKATKE